MVVVANTTKGASGAVGDPRGVVQNVAPLQDREMIFDGSEVYADGLRVIEGIAHVVTVTPANVEIGDIFTILLGGNAIAAYTALAATVQDVVEGLQAAWESGKAAYVESAGVTATEDNTKVTLTADATGRPFTVTATAVDGGGADTQTLTVAVTANNDTFNVVQDANHILGTKSIEFDKVDGSNNKINAGVERADLDLDLRRFTAEDIIEAYLYVSATTDIASVEVRLGTDASNYNAWVLDDSAITGATWQQFKKTLSECTVAVVGNGWDPEEVRYAALVVIFDLATDTLADILLDHVMVRSVTPAS